MRGSCRCSAEKGAVEGPSPLPDVLQVRLRRSRPYGRFEPKTFVQISGACHVDLYERDEHVRKAVNAMDGFFQEHSGARKVAA